MYGNAAAVGVGVVVVRVVRVVWVRVAGCVRLLCG
jgi:hypothetical protein